MLRRQLAILISSCCLALPAHALDLGKLLSGENLDSAIKVIGNVSEAVKEVTPQQEIIIGQSVMANLLGAAPLVKDAALQKYVNQVGMWVAAQSEEPTLAWHFGIIDSPNINAFAAPGGYILITRGMWDRIRSEAELAVVLGHEITHVLKKHHLRAMRGDKWQGALSETITLGASVKGVKGGQKILTNLGKAGSEVFVRGLDKGDEYDADNYGMVLAARAGYNPYALVSVLQTLGTVNAADATVALMFSTHPSPQDRLDKLESNIGDQLENYAGGAENTPRFSKFKKP